MKQEKNSIQINSKELDINWEEREIELELSLTIRSEKEWNTLTFDFLKGGKFDLEDAFEKRKRVVKEVETQKLVPFLELLTDEESVIEKVVKFLSSCKENGYDIQEEVKWLKENKIKKWIEMLESSINSKTKWKNEYKATSSMYKSY